VIQLIIMISMMAGASVFGLGSALRRILKQGSRLAERHPNLPKSAHFLSFGKKFTQNAWLLKKTLYLCRRMLQKSINAKMMKYVAPSAEFVRLQLEGVIADSCYPVIKNGQVQYYEYENAILETPVGKDVIIL
jgi:hypothetical protein